MPTFSTWKKIYVKRIRGRLKSAKWIERYLNMAEARWKARPLDSIRRAAVEALYQKIDIRSRTAQIAVLDVIYVLLLLQDSTRLAVNVSRAEEELLKNRL